MPAKRPFQEGDTVLWQRTEQGMRALRRCQFVGYTPGGGALVAYGTNEYKVGLGELSPEPGPQPVPFLPGGKISVPFKPQPLSDDQITAQLRERRHELRDAHSAAQAASEAVAQAKAVHERATKEYEQARSALLVLDQHHRQNLRGLERALRDNQPVPALENGVDRNAVVTRAQLTEKALQRFRQELADASSHLGQAQSLVREAAKSVVAGLIDAECEAARLALHAVLKTRQRLINLSSWWPDASGPIKLSAAFAESLTAPLDLDAFRFGVGSGAPQAWQDLLAKLIDGDAEAAYQEAATLDRVEAA